MDLGKYFDIFRKKVDPNKCYRCRHTIEKHEVSKTFDGHVYHAYCFRKSKKEGLEFCRKGEIMNAGYYN
mgnify:CR=1 FL=1